MKKIKLLIFALVIWLSMPNPNVVAASRVRIIYFYSNYCEQCHYIKDDFLPSLLQKYPDLIKVEYLEFSENNNFELLLDLEKQSGKKINKTPPLIYIGDTFLEGASKIQTFLEDTILRQLDLEHNENNPPVKSERKTSSLEIVEQFKSLGVATVIFGGLLDGINPCAFTTLIFLISYLSFIGRKGAQLIFSGLFFSLGVFVAYFAIGLGLLEVLGRVSILIGLGKLLTIFVVIMSVSLGIINLYDFLQLRKGRTDAVKLQLGDYFKKKIHASIRNGAKSTTFIRASLVMGVLVGLFEFPCTGQVYFPIILALREFDFLRMNALFYLIIYNLLFILPLLIVFMLAYWGVTSSAISKLVQKNLARIKLITALFFFGLATIIIAL